MIGQRVNNFRIVRLIGEGGMGSVYEAEHPLIHRKVAVKILRPDHARDPVLVKRFFNEARATSEIRHPNIVEIVDVGTLPDGVPYLVMEMLEGENLLDRLDAVGSLDLCHALYFACQAADALQAAHEHGIIHRDLKPDNLFVVPCEHGEQLIKVLDFGIAKLRGDASGSCVRTSPGAVLGTPAYMSPEQCRGVPEDIGPATDIYALGIILYEMLCGEPPFLAIGLGEVLMMHMSAVPTLPSQRRPDVPADVEAVVSKAIAKRPEDRFESMAAFAVALRATRAFPADAPVRLDAPGRRSVPLKGPERASRPDTMPTLVAAGPTTGAEAFQATALRDVASLKPVTQEPPRRVSRRTLPITAAALGALAVLGAMLLLGAHQSQRVHALARMHRLAFADTQPLPATVPRAATAATAPVLPIAAEPDLPVRAAARSRFPERSASAKSAASATPSVASSAPTELALAPPVPGYLSLDSAPWASVSLGGRSLGVTPLLRIALPPGRHVLKLENPELRKTTSYVVDIQSGRATSRFVGWGND